MAVVLPESAGSATDCTVLAPHPILLAPLCAGFTSRTGASPQSGGAKVNFVLISRAGSPPELSWPVSTGPPGVSTRAKYRQRIICCILAREMRRRVDWYQSCTSHFDIRWPWLRRTTSGGEGSPQKKPGSRTLLQQRRREEATEATETGREKVRTASSVLEGRRTRWGPPLHLGVNSSLRACREQ